MLQAFTRKLGLNEVDAQDATQETFLAFARAYQAGQYNQQKGRLRSWLFKIAQNKVCDFHRRLAREPAQFSGDEQEQCLEQEFDEGQQVEFWEDEWRQALIRTCLDLVRRDVAENTFAAFEEITVKERSPDDVARDLGMTRAAVTKANQRVLSRMRELHQILDMEW